MPSSNDIKAGGAWLEFSADYSKLRDAIVAIDGRLKTFTARASSVVSRGMTKAFIGLGVAVMGAKKGYEALNATMAKMRDTGTAEQKEAVAKLDRAVNSLKESFTNLLTATIEKSAQPAAKAIERIQTAIAAVKSILQQLQERFSNVFSAIGQGTSKFGELWDKWVNKAIESSPTLAKAAADSLQAAGKKAMEGWQADNTLLDQLDQINDKVNRSSEDIAKANSIVAQLNSRWGDVGLSVDQVTGKIEGMGEAQKRILDLQNKARIAQLEAEKAANLQQQKALEAANRRTMENAGPGATKVFGSYLWNTVKSPFTDATYKSAVEIGEGLNQGAFEEARRKVEETRAEQAALKAQSESLDAQLEALRAGQNWYEEAGVEATKDTKTPVGSNTKAGSMVDKYAGLSPAEQEIAKLNDQYASLLQERVEQFRQHGYSEEEATKLATEEFANDRKAVDERTAQIRTEAAKKEAEILTSTDISKDAADVNKSELDKELEAIEERYITARKDMIDQLMSLGRTEEEAAKMADEHLAAERVAADKLKAVAIRRDAQEKAAKRAEELQRQAEAAKAAEIAEARAYVDEIERGLEQSERSYSSSGGTFSAFDEIDSYNIAAESLNTEKAQLQEQKKMVERMRELIDLYEQTDTTTAVFA